MTRLLVGSWLGGAGVSFAVASVVEDIPWLFPGSATFAFLGLGILVKADR